MSLVLIPSSETSLVADVVARARPTSPPVSCAPSSVTIMSRLPNRGGPAFAAEYVTGPGSPPLVSLEDVGGRMPTFVLSIVSLAGYVRYLRASMLEVLKQDYVRTARAKGLDDRRVVWIHAFKNAALPLVTLIAMNIPRIFSGALITEQVFAWPGMGRLFVDHATRVDYPVLMGLVMSVAALVVVFSLVADIIYAYLDPRIRYS